MGDEKVCVNVAAVALLLLIGIPLGSIYINQCWVGAGDSLHVQVQQIQLTTKPTDNVLFGWEWLFGKPSDEISMKLQSGFCKASNKPRKIKKGQVITFGTSLSINTFFSQGFSFQLVEADGGLEGADDYSPVISVPDYKMKIMRDAFDNGIADNIQLVYAVTVKGANIFQENRLFGFLAENLCVGALDFIVGPWTAKALVKGMLLSKDVAKLYKTVGKLYQTGKLSKKSLFKALLTYQVRAGVKKAIINPTKENMIELVKEWALSQPLLDKMINETVRALTEEGVFPKSIASPYQEVYREVDSRAGYLESFTDSLEFCLSDVWPRSRNAVYDVYLTITR